MKIDLPITIIFDCQETNPGAISRAAGHVVCTLRYETGGDGSDAVLFGSYPPNEKPFLCAGREHIPQGEPAQTVLAFISAATDKRVNERAANSPYDYLHHGVSDADRDAAQAAADAERAQDGPSD